MKWVLQYEKAALNDLKQLDGSQRVLVLKAITRVSENPLPQNEGGYGKPIGHHNSSNLTGLCKIVLKKAGIRVVYKVIRSEHEMNVIVVGMRSDEESYQTAKMRLFK